MIELFSGLIPVHYRFIYLTRMGEYPKHDEARRGQSNGLCGAATPHQLVLITGLHTGQVSLMAEWHPTEPSLDSSWEDVVEVSFDVPQRDLVLASFEYHCSVDVPAVGTHRARYSADSMDAAKHFDQVSHRDLGPDSYLLQLWPAPSEPDRIVRQTSHFAAYWHALAQGS
ncbi:hypothetical protein [Phytoactinopolyspora halotolerans]|uniref:Uncharacterized protein n=1 Tax=Phytoactinopolyspora halotolerans TaxID=1981512 RepID=A0A6L9SJ98_9ACTN|nr:hypothetical protein [Phytoactinopolyspora halotolerans]NEE04768.1 hypothetical protein [Phytoactinopolyspora halotolerans]